MKNVVGYKAYYTEHREEGVSYVNSSIKFELEDVDVMLQIVAEKIKSGVDVCVFNVFEKVSENEN